MSLKHSAASGIKWTTLSTATAAVLQIVQLTVLARLLKPADFGLMAMTMVVIGFAQAYADMGISAAVIHKQNVTRDQLSTLYWLNVGSGALVYAAVCAMTPLIVLFFHETKLYQLLPVVASSFFISSVGIQFLWLLEKELQFNTLAKQEIAATVVGTVVAITMAFLGYNVWSLVWGQIASAVVRAFCLCLVGFRRWRPHLHFRRSDLEGYVSFGLYQMGERSLNYLNSRIDQLLIGSLLGAQDLGYYNFAFNLVLQPVSRINPVLTRVAFPVLAKMQDDIPKLQKSYLKMMNVLSTVNAPVLLGMSAVAPVLVPLVFGTKWIPAIPLLQVLAFYAFIRSTGNPVGSLLLARGRADLGFRWNLAISFFISPAVFIGAKVGASMGIALTLVALQVFLNAACYFYLVKPLVGRCGKEYAATVLRPLLLSCAMYVGVWLVSLMGTVSVLWLTGEILAGAVIYLLLLWSFDRELIFEVGSILKGSRA